MRVHFVASIAGKQLYEDRYRLIIRSLEELHCTVGESIMDVSLNTSSSLSEHEARKVYRMVLADIRDSDAFVCDMTYKSPGVAMEVQDSVYRYKKPSLILYHEDKKGRLAAPFWGNPSNLLFIKKYNDANCKDILKDFIDKARRKIPSSRFTVRMNEEMDDYVEYLRILWREYSKNRVVNRIIHERMVTDPDYKIFQKARLGEL